MIDKRVGSVEQALDGLVDGCSVMVNGFGGAGVPVQLIRAIEAKGVRDLTLILNTIRFVDGCAPKFFAEKRVRKVVTTAARSRSKEPSNYERQLETGELEIELVPQGTLAERMRAGGAGIPAFYTATGYGTKVAEGKEVREFDGRPCIIERALRADFAFIKAWKGDKWGNLVYRKTARNFNPMMATAARVTIVEVEELVEVGQLPPDLVHTPSVYVHRIFQGASYEKRIEKRTVRQA